MALTASNSSVAIALLSVTLTNNADYNYGSPPIENVPGRPPPPPPPYGPPSASPNYDQPNTIQFVAEGLIIPIGLIFNFLSFLVCVSSPKLRITTTGHYLMALAIADTLFLIGELIRWMNPPGTEHLGLSIDFLDRIDSLCKIVMWLRYGSTLASAWITVAIAVERFITVAFPLRVGRLSTPKITKIAIAAIFVLSTICTFAAGAFPLWTVGVMVSGESTMCAVTDKQLYMILNFTFLWAVSLFVPWALIVVFCILIVVCLSRAKRARHRHLSVRSVRSTETTRMERQLTAMFLAVSVAFILLRLPYGITYYLYTHTSEIFGDPVDPMTKYKVMYAMKISDIFTSINYSINFFLYCLCGSFFREQLKRLCCCQTRHGRWRTSTRSRHSGYPGTPV